MTALTWQTMLLLGLAYFAGCWIACVVRRTIGARSTETVPATRVAAPLQEVSPRPVPQPVTVARQPQPEPVAVPVRDGFRRADTLEPSPEGAAKKAPPAPVAPVAPPAAKPAPPPQPQAAAPGAPSATRFERALSGEGTAAARPAPAPAPVAKPVASEAAPVVRQPEPPKPQAAPPPPVPAPAARPPAPAPAATTNLQKAAAAAGTVASAVTAAAAATQANPTVRVPAPSAPVPPQPPAKPPAAAAAPTVQAAPRPATAGTPQVHDDLRRIRAIDAEVASALNRLGITRYAQIAAWKSDDVARINRELGSKNRVEQENWIEQAQMLARGEETFYARRLSRGELPRALPAADEGSPKIVSAPSAPASPPQPVATGIAPAVRSGAPAPPPGQMQLRAGGETAAAAAAALAAAAASRSATTAQAPVPQTAPAKPAAPAAASTPAPSPAPQAVVRPAPTPAPSAVAVTPPEVSSRAAFARGTPVAPVPTATEKAPPQAASSGSVPVVSARPAQQPVESQPVRAAVGTARDDLQRIGGINAEIERLLNGQGITRYTQIARWGSSETERFDRLLGRPGRIASENWVGQAERLAAGGAPATPAEPSPDAPPRSQRLADAIRENQPQADESDPRQPRSSDISGLRSVRSEAFRGDATGPGSVPAVGAGTGRTAPPDDLKRIRGIGVLIEKKLNSMGITSYDQIANWSSGDVDRVSEILDFKGRIERENWVEQARILAAGGQTEFSRRADRGDLYGDR